MAPDPAQLSAKAQAVISDLLVRFGSEGASELITNITKVSTSFRDAHKNVANLEKGLNIVARGFQTASSSISSFGGFFNAANLSLKTGVDMAYKYNQAMVATFSQFQKYNMSVEGYRKQVDSIRNSYRLTYDESIRLASGFEKSFNQLGPEKMDNVLKSVAKTVGKDAQAMESFLQGITAVTAQNPELERMLDNVEGNADAINSYVTGLRIAGEISMKDYKDFLNMTSAGGRNATDQSGLDAMQDQNLSLRKIQNVYEDGILKSGKDVLSVTKYTVDKIGEWADYMPNILRFYTEISAAAGGIAGGTTGILNTIQGMANLKILMSGAGAAGAAGGAGSAAAAGGGILAASGGVLGAVALGGMAAYGGYQAGGAIYNGLGGNELIDSAVNSMAYTKNGSSLQQYSGASDTAGKRAAYLERHKTEIEANEKILASEKKIAEEQKAQERNLINLDKKRELATVTLERQKNLVAATTGLLEAQAQYVGRTGGSTRGTLTSLNAQLDQNEKDAREKLEAVKSQAAANNKQNDPKTLAEVAKIETDLFNIQKQRADAARTYVKENEPQLEQNRALIGLQESQIALADSAGLGLRAQVSQRKELIDSLSKEISLSQVQLQKAQQQKAEAQARGDAYKVFEMETEILKIKQEQTAAVQKQAEASKAMREGWIGAIQAMTTGAGVFSRIVITQNQRLGNLQFAGPDRLKTLRGGGVMGGKTESDQWLPVGFRQGAAGAHEQGVLSQYSLPSGNGLQATAAAMMGWQGAVGSKMNPSAAAFGVGPQGTAEVTTAVSEGFKKAIVDSNTSSSPVVILTEDAKKTMLAALVQSFDEITKALKTEVIKSINSGR